MSSPGIRISCVAARLVEIKRLGRGSPRAVWIFRSFSGPPESQSHDCDVRALLRIAVIWNVPVACNRASVDFIITSLLMTEPYERFVPDYDGILANTHESKGYTIMDESSKYSA
jgi:hypothetical protein